ncbi:MAG: hypothetical protein V2A62_01610 [Candidatus Woesearchaeota archaeon]
MDSDDFMLHSPQIEHGIGERKWTLEELLELESERVTAKIKEIQKLDQTIYRKHTRINALNGRLFEETESLPPSRYEDLSMEHDKKEQEMYPLEEMRRVKITELEKLADLNFYRLIKRKEAKQLEERKKELTPYLEEIRNYPLSSKGRVESRKELREKKKEFEEILHVGKDEPFEWDNTLYRPLKAALAEVWKEKLYQYREILLQTKKDGTWKKAFEGLWGYSGFNEVCDHLDLDLILAEEHGNQNTFSYRCGISGDECVGEKDNHSAGGEFDCSRCYLCIGYNLPLELVALVKDKVRIPEERLAWHIKIGLVNPDYLK